MTAPQTIDRATEISNTLMKMKPEFAEMLSKTGINPDKFTRVAIMSVQQKPELMQCTANSLYKSFSDCARDGLIPDGSEAALVKFGNEAVYMPMVEGVLKLFRNSGECGSVDAHVVFEKDQYESWTDEKGPHFKHVKSREKDKGKSILTYAYAITKDNHLYFEEMTEDDILSVRNIAKTKMVWDGPFKYEMYRKSALRRLSKRLPKSTDIEAFRERHDEGFELEPEPTPEPGQEETTSSRLGAVIDAKTVSAASEPAKPAVEPAKDAAWHENAPAPATADPKPEPTDPDPPPQAGPQAAKKVQGIIENIKVKSAPPGTKPYWTRYGVNIGNAWYGTFDKKLHDEMNEYYKQRIFIEVEYKEAVKANQVYFEIVSLRQVTAADMAGKEGMPF